MAPEEFLERTENEVVRLVTESKFARSSKARTNNDITELSLRVCAVQMLLFARVCADTM